MFNRFNLKLGLLGLILVAGTAVASIGPPVQVRIVGEIPEYVPGESRKITIEVSSIGEVFMDYMAVAGKGWTVQIADLPLSKSMRSGERMLFEVDAATTNADEPLVISMLANDQPFEHTFDLSPAAVARSRGAVPGRAESKDPGAAPSVPPADADAPGDGNKAARNIRVFGKVWTTRPDGVSITAPNCKISIWEDDVDPNPDDFIVDGTTDANGNFDITFYWDGVSEAEPDLYFVYWYEDGNVRLQDANGSLYGYRAATTWNYTGTFLNMGTWYPATGFEPVGFLYSHLSRGSETLWLAGGASQVWDTPQVQCQWFPGSGNGPDHSGSLIRMNGTRMWAESIIHHEFGHHWHNSFSNISPFNYCNATCDSGGGCGHCLWCNEELGAAWNEGLANFIGEILYTNIASIFGPAPYAGAGAELYSFESVNASSGQCNAGHVPNAAINEGYVAALLRDIYDTANDNDPSVGSGVDQLALSWEEILTTVDLDNPVDAMDFLAHFNARYNWYQSALVQTALNNGFPVSNSTANLEPLTLAGWPYAALPRSTNNTTVSSAPISATLNGNANSTWLNGAFHNTGGFPTLNGINNTLTMDGVVRQNLTAGTMVSGGGGFGGNLGPFTITGGRHTAGLITDSNNDESESNESDNEFARQWVWSPLTLPNGVTARNAPPIKNGGWSSVPAGSQTLYNNSDGFRLSRNGFNTQVVGIRSLEATDDYDLRQHVVSINSQNGFGSAPVQSGQLAGSTDFILVNYNVATSENRDFGVVNYSGGTGQFHIERSNNSATTNLTADGQSKVHNIVSNQLVQVGQIYTPAGGTGPTYFQIDVSPASSPVRVAWYDAGTGVESRAQANVDVITDASGRARLFMNTTADTWTPFVIYRDAAQGFGPVTVTFKADATPAELVTDMALGSFGPVVPRDNTASPLSIGDPIVAPSFLVGDESRTNVFVQLKNTGPRASLQYDVSWLLDGEAPATFDFGTAAANSGLLGTVAGPFYMSGGRHTQGMFVDSADNNEELDETNNRWAAQWAWSPTTVGLDVPWVRAAPPVSEGGWGDVPAGVITYANADGLHTPLLGAAGAQYAAMAILPLGTSDFDIYLHEASTSPQTGFTSYMVGSDWGGSVSDYVLVNFAQTLPREFDVGIRRWSGADNYRTQVTESVDLGAATVPGYDASMPSTSIMHLYEVDLPAEPIEVRLENLTGTVNWGLTVHDPATVYDTKYPASAVVENANGDGQDESAFFTAPAAGRYAIAVWKSGGSDEGKSGQYRLKVLRTLVSEVPGDGSVPRVSTITGVHPNPFNPRTTVAFDVAKSGSVKLRLFDVKGKLVRVLADGIYAVGRHEVAWNGTDDTGRAVASGVYFVRMSGLGVEEMSKMMLLK